MAARPTRQPAGGAPRVFAVVGGAGAMGRITVRDLMETCALSDEVLVADHDLERASALAATFPAGPYPRIRAVRVDVRDRAAASRRWPGPSWW